MSRLINETIIVHSVDTYIVKAFIWRRRVYRVSEIISWWREPGRWWEGEPLIRLFLRVTATHTVEGVYELCKNGKAWSLSRVLD